MNNEFDIAAKNEIFLDSNRKPKCQNNKSYNCVTKKRVKKTALKFSIDTPKVIVTYGL